MTKEPRVRKDTEATHPDVLVEQEKFLVPTNRERAYRIMIPVEPKELDPKFKMPDTSTGRACRNLAMLKEAEQQIKEDRLAAEKRVIRELKREKRTDFQLQVGRKICQIAVNHQDPKDSVKVKFA